MRSAAAACVTLLALLASALQPVPAHAAQSLSISPPKINLTAAAGETVTTEITVRAPDDAVEVELVHLDVGFDGETYETRLIRDDAPETTSFSTRGWFSLAEERTQIPAGGTKQLELRVAVPPNTPGGTYIGAAILRPVLTAPAPGESGQVRAVGQIGPIVFIAVEGGDPPKPVLDAFTLPRFVTGGPLRPEVIVRNDGDDFFTFTGTITLDGDDEDPLTIEQQYVVPDAPRAVRTTAGEKDDEGALKLGSSSLGIGRHVVEVRLRTEPTGRTLVATRTVWVVPIWVRLLLALGLAGIGYCIYRIIAFLRRREPQVVLEPEAEPELVDDEGIDDDESLLDDGFETEFDDEEYDLTDAEVDALLDDADIDSLSEDDS